MILVNGACCVVHKLELPNAACRVAAISLAQLATWFIGSLAADLIYVVVFTVCCLSPSPMANLHAAGNNHLNLNIALGKALGNCRGGNGDAPMDYHYPQTRESDLGGCLGGGIFSAGESYQCNNANSVVVQNVNKLVIHLHSCGSHPTCGTPRAVDLDGPGCRRGVTSMRDQLKGIVGHKRGNVQVWKHTVNMQSQSSQPQGFVEDKTLRKRKLRKPPPQPEPKRDTMIQQRPDSDSDNDIMDIHAAKALRTEQDSDSSSTNLRDMSDDETDLDVEMVDTRAESSRGRILDMDEQVGQRNNLGL